MCRSVGSEVIGVLRLRTAPATNSMAFIGMEMPSTFSVALGYCSLQSTAWSRGQTLHFGIWLDFVFLFISSASQLFIAFQ